MKTVTWAGFLLNKLASIFRPPETDKVPSLTETVSLENVSFGFSEAKILTSVSLTLNEHRIGIIGNNGSGKSTLIRMLNGLNQPTEGRIDIFGLDTQRYHRHLPNLVGFIFQNPDHQIIFPTVLEELAFGLEQQGCSTKLAQSRAREFLKLHGVASLADKPVQNLSEGQKQLVCILAVLVMKPRLLLLDEPFSSLDLLKRKSLQHLIETQCERFIMVSHDLDVLADFDRVIWIHEGRVRGDGSPDNVIQNYRTFANNNERLITVQDF